MDGYISMTVTFLRKNHHRPPTADVKSVVRRPFLITLTQNRHRFIANAHASRYEEKATSASFWPHVHLIDGPLSRRACTVVRPRLVLLCCWCSALSSSWTVPFSFSLCLESGVAIIAVPANKWRQYGFPDRYVRTHVRVSLSGTRSTAPLGALELRSCGCLQLQHY